MTNTLRNLALAGLTALAMGGCYELREPKRDDYNKASSALKFNFPLAKDTLSVPSFSTRDLMIFDVDSNGTADIIGNRDDGVELVAEEFYDLDIINDMSARRAKLMTSEIREAATRALQADQNLSYLMAKEQYTSYLKNKQGRK